MEEYLRHHEVMKELGVGKNAAYTIMKAVGVTKFGSSMRVERGRLMEYVRSCTQRPVPPMATTVRPYHRRQPVDTQ